MQVGETAQNDRRMALVIGHSKNDDDKQLKQTKTSLSLCQTLCDKHFLFAYTADILISVRTLTEV